MKSSARISVLLLFAGFLACAIESRMLMQAPMSVQAPTPSAALMSIMSATDAAMMAVQPCTSVDIYYAKSMTAHHEGAITMAEWELHYGRNKQLLNISASIISSQAAQIAQFAAILGELPIPAACTPTMAPSSMGMGGSGSMAPSATSPGADALMASMAGMGMDAMTMGSTAAPASPMPGMDMGSSPSGEGMTTDMAADPTMDMSMNMTMSMGTPVSPPVTLNGNPDRDFALEMMMHHQAAVNMSEVELQYGTSAPLLKLANQIIAEQSKEIDQFKMILAQDYAVTA